MKKAGIKSALICCLLFGLASSTIFCQTVLRYDGGGSNVTWANSNNWSSNNRPNTNGESAQFDGTSDGDLSVNLFGSSFTIGQIEVLSPASTLKIINQGINVNDSLLTVDPSANFSNVGIDMAAATKNFSFEGNTPWTYRLGSSQTWDVTSTATNGDLTSTSNVTVNLQGNTLTTNAGTGRNISIAGAVTGAGGITKVGAGTLSLTGNSTYTGATIVSQGTLLVDGSLSNEGGLTVASGATLGGTGTIGGTTTINGAHTPGSSPGTQNFNNLTYNAGSSVEWELINNTTSGPGTNFDRIMVAGDLNFAGSTTLNLNFNSVDGSNVDWTDSFWGLYNIREWQIWGIAGSTTGFPGNLELSDPSTWVDSNGLTFSDAVGNQLASSANFYLFENNNSVYLRYEALPEPTTFGLLGLLLSGLTVFARPKRRLRFIEDKS